MHIHTQLNFGGNCEEAFRFYERELGGKILMMIDQSHVPGAPKGPGPQIIHARMTIGDIVLTGNDVPASVFKPIRSVYLTLLADTAAEAERFHNLLSNDGEVFIPLQENFFATRFSQLRDRFGVLWSILHERPRP